MCKDLFHFVEEASYFYDYFLTFSGIVTNIQKIEKNHQFVLWWISKCQHTCHSSTQRKNQKMTSISQNPLVHFQILSSIKADFHPLSLISKYLLFVWLLVCRIVWYFSFSIVFDCLNILQLIFPLDYWWTAGLFKVLGYYVEWYYEHSFTYFW